MSDNRVIYICPLCGTTYSNMPGKKNVGCQECKIGTLIETGFSQDVWRNKTDEDKQIFRDAVRRNGVNRQEPVREYSGSIQRTSSNDQNISNQYTTCPKCGKLYPSHMDSCLHCGAPKNWSQEFAKKAERKKGIKTVAIIALVMMAITAVVSLNSNSNSQNSSQQGGDSTTTQTPTKTDIQDVGGDVVNNLATADKIGFGSITDNIYRNDFFNVTLPFSNSWSYSDIFELAKESGTDVSFRNCTDVGKELKGIEYWIDVKASRYRDAQVFFIMTAFEAEIEEPPLQVAYNAMVGLAGGDQNMHPVHATMNGMQYDAVRGNDEEGNIYVCIPIIKGEYLGVVIFVATNEEEYNEGLETVKIGVEDVQQTVEEEQSETAEEELDETALGTGNVEDASSEVIEDDFLEDLKKDMDSALAEKVATILRDEIGFTDLKYVERIGTTTNYNITADGLEIVVTAWADDGYVRVFTPNGGGVYYEDGKVLMTAEEKLSTIIKWEDRTSYYLMAQEIVKGSLKNPRSAKFPSINSGEITFVKKGDIVGVQSYVDATNSLGAQLRTSWTVEFTPKDMDTYSYDVIYIRIGNQEVGEFVDLQ